MFMAQALLYNRKQFVWLDETGCDNCDTMRRYGYAIRGLTPHCHRLLVRGARISVIASDGLVAYECTQGTVNSEVFFNFV